MCSRNPAGKALLTYEDGSTREICTQGNPKLRGGKVCGLGRPVKVELWGGMPMTLDCAQHLVCPYNGEVVVHD